MRSETICKVGRVRVDGAAIEFVPADELTFDASQNDAVSVGVQYDYRERSDDQERARVKLTVYLEGQPPQTIEADIHDNPILDDSRRGFVSVPIRLTKSGELRGRFEVEATYTSGAWGAKDKSDDVTKRAAGAFTLRVR